MSDVRVYKVDGANRLLSVIDDLRSLASSICEENARLKDELERSNSPQRPMITTEKSEIANKIIKWATDGSIVMRNEFGKRSEIAKKIKRGELFHTSFGSLLATSKDVLNEFESYVDNGVVVDSNKLAVKYRLTTLFAIKKACSKGQVIRLDCFGKSIALYVV